MTIRWITGAICLCLAACAMAQDAWTDINTQTEAGLAGDEIQYLSVARDGGVWVGTLSGLTHVKDGKFSPVLDAKGKTRKMQTWCVYEPADGEYMVGHNQGVLHVRGDEQTDEMKGFNVAPIIEVAPGVVWAIAKQAGTETNFLYQYVDGAWSPVPEAAKLRVVNIVKDSQSRIWIILEGNGLLLYTHETGWDKATNHLQGLNVTAVADAGARTVWAGLWARGIASWEGTEWKNYLQKEKESAFLDIVADRHANVWASTTASGLWYKPFNKDEWTNHLADEGAINLLALTADGRAWVSSQNAGGLRYWNGEKWIASLDSPLPMQCFLELPNGDIWAGGVLDGLHILKKK